MQENQLQTFMFLFILSSVAQNMSATGAFEIILNDKVLFSKIGTGRLPTLQEIVQLMEREGFHKVSGL